jgi:hypothetical protein
MGDGTCSSQMKQKVPTWNSSDVSWISTLPFTLNGRPYVTNPTSLQGVSEYRRKTGALTNTQANGYFSIDQYDLINLTLNNVIGADSSTTLRYNNNSYTQRFIALHKNIWDNNGVSVSIFFATNDMEKFFHICIPVELANNSNDENIFLKSWLYQNPSTNIPSNLTTNELLNFRKSSGQYAKFYTIQYCLQVDTRTTKTYVLCMFNDSIKVNRTQLPGWIQNDPTMSTPSNVNKKTIDQILNLMLKGVFNFVIPNTDMVDGNLVSQNTYFMLTDQNNIQGTAENTIRSIYYNVPIKSLAGSLFRQPTKPGIKTLENIKCYPIDLASQINSDGSINIDEQTNKPLSPKDAASEASTEPITYDADADLKAKEQKDNWIFMIVALVTFGILLVIGIIVIVFVLRGRSIGSLPAPVTVVPST